MTTNAAEYLPNIVGKAMLEAIAKELRAQGLRVALKNLHGWHVTFAGQLKGVSLINVDVPSALPPWMKPR